MILIITILKLVGKGKRFDPFKKRKRGKPDLNGHDALGKGSQKKYRKLYRFVGVSPF